MRFIPKKLITVLGQITFWFLLALIAVAGIRLFTRKRVPSGTVLEIHLERPLVERAQPGFLRFLQPRPALTLRSAVNAINHAAENKKVNSLIVHLGSGQSGAAKLQEIREAIVRFRAKGKRAIAFAETFGQARGATFTYYLATACDEIYLQQSGEFGLTGLVSQTMFLQGALEKLGIKPRLDSREEYKSAKYVLTQDHYIPPHEEANRRVMESLFEQALGVISQTRGIPQDRIRDLIDNAPYSAQQAKELGFVDEIAYVDQVRRKLTEKDRFLPISDYISRTGNGDGRSTIALIYGIGEIYVGKNQRSPLTGQLMGSETMIDAFRQAVEDKSVKAIVFRVNSPGGSYVASDAIWRAVVRARDAGKPVIVSMSNVAASGGYFVAAPATKILADPATITGSIGVVSGKLITTSFWNKLGITYDEIHTSKNATMHLPTEDYTEQQWEQLQESLDRIYNDFVSKVSQGRNMSVDQVKDVAGGRIWTGAQAVENGLVDTLGGLEQAIDQAKLAIDLKPDDRVKLKIFPKRKTLLQTILGEGGTKSSRSVSLPSADIPINDEMLEIVQRLGRLSRKNQLLLDVDIPVE